MKVEEDPYFSFDGGDGKGAKEGANETYRVMGGVLLFMVVMAVFGGMRPSSNAPYDAEHHDVQPSTTARQPAEVVSGHTQIITRVNMSESVVAGHHSDTAQYSESEMVVGENVHIVVRTCPSSQPLVRLFPNYLPHPMFESLRKDLHASASLSDSSLLEDNFGHTTGWMIRFSAEGIHRVRSHPKFSMVMPYFDKARNSEANAFVINYLVCNQPPEGENAVNFHLDNSVAMMSEVTSNYTIVAHQVNVLYLDVPEGIEGGNLEVWPFERGSTELDKTVVSPGENLMAEFRGDAFHKVGQMKLPDGKQRVGIVFEQYKIMENFYSYLIPFCVGDDCNKIAVGELLA